jgi:dihydroorotate dehydrogenase electron transfer subunit
VTPLAGRNGRSRRPGDGVPGRSPPPCYRPAAVREPPPLDAPEFPQQALGEILENRPVARATWLMKVHAPAIAPAIRPGHFVNIRTTHDIVPLLRRPMSVHRVIRSGESATGFAVLYDVVGPGTRALAAMPKGGRLDFVGPLGNEVSIPAGTRRAILVAGGVGVGPVKIVAEELQRRGVRDVTVCYGARDFDHVVPNEDVAPHGCRLLISTDDGSVGRKGRVTMFVEDLLTQGRLTKESYVFACGPPAMFRALQDVLGPRGIPCEAATEEFMGCGFGVCFGCTLRVKDDDGTPAYRLCCVDGCIFPLDRLVLDGVEHHR